MATGVSTFKCHSCTRRNGTDGKQLSGEQLAGEQSPSTGINSRADPCETTELRELVTTLLTKIEELSSAVRQLKNDNEGLRFHLARNSELLRRHLVRPDAVSTELFPCVDASQGAVCDAPVPSNPAGTAHFSTGQCSSSTHGAGAMNTRLSFSRVLQKPTDMNGFTGGPTRRLGKASEGKAESSKLVSVPRVPRERALFVSRLHPSTTVADITDALRTSLPEVSVTCTKLRSRYDTYSSFHISVKGDHFDSINEANVWPDGCIFRPFFGKLQLNGNAEDSVDK